MSQSQPALLVGSLFRNARVVIRSHLLKSTLRQPMDVAAWGNGRGRGWAKGGGGGGGFANARYGGGWGNGGLGVLRNW